MFERLPLDPTDIAPDAGTGPGAEVQVEPPAEPAAPAPPDRARPWEPLDLATTAGFVVALAVMFLVANRGVEPRTVWVLAIAYLALASLWVGRQLHNSLKGESAVLPARWVIGLVAGGALLFLPVLVVRPGAMGVSSFAGSVAFAGALIAYLGIGYGVARARARVAALPLAADVAPRSWFDRYLTPTGGAVALTAMFALTVAGLATLGEAPLWIPVVLLGLGLLGLPLTVSVLSEHGIRYFMRRPDRVLASVLVGVLALTCGFAAAASSGATGVPYLVLLGFALFVVILASSSMADIAVVLLLIALMGVTAPEDGTLDRPEPDDRVLVALGDSYISGEGAERYLDATDEAGINQCRRARTAWPVRVTEDTDHFDSLVFLGCSGADTYNVRLQQDGALAPLPDPQFGKGTQLDEWKAEWADLVPDPALVVVSLGGNDAGFSKIGLACLAPGDCNDPELRHIWRTGNLDRVENRLRQAYTDIAETFPDSPVAVIPYPDPVADTAPCAEAALSPGDVVFIDGLLRDLDTIIAEVAAEFGFYFIEPAIDSLADAHKQLCDPRGGDAGLNFLRPQSTGGLAHQRFNPTQWHHNSLHPNPDGHEAIAAAVAAWLDSEASALSDGAEVRLPREPGPDPVDETYPANEGECWTVDPVSDTGRTCADESADWVADEVGRFALGRGIVLLLIGIGIWLVCVPGFARLRARRLRRNRRWVSGS